MKKLIILIFFAFLVFFVRFFDFFIVWSFGKSEFNKINIRYYAENVQCKDIYNHHIGLSTYRSAISELNMLVKLRGEKIIIVSYFNLIHPNIYLIYNKNSKICSVYPLPWMFGTTVYPGLNEIYLFKFEYLIHEHQNNTDKGYRPLFGSPLSIASVTEFHESFKSNSDKHDYSLYRKKLYMIYFFFPLASMLFFLVIFGRSILISCIYFLELFVLFDLKMSFKSINFWYYLFEKQRMPHLSVIIAIFIFLLSLILIYKGIVIGFREKRLKNLGFIEKFIIIFLIMMPIILRF